MNSLSDNRKVMNDAAMEALKKGTSVPTEAGD
jgi:hypothetical protein